MDVCAFKLIMFYLYVLWYAYIRLYLSCLLLLVCVLHELMWTPIMGSGPQAGWPVGRAGGRIERSDSRIGFKLQSTRKNKSVS
jgi:hypothetical protein